VLVPFTGPLGPSWIPPRWRCRGHFVGRYAARALTGMDAAKPAEPRRPDKIEIQGRK